MFRVLFVLFIIIPIIEISVLMQVGELLGMWPTIGIVILSAWIGAKYVRQQGIATLQSVQTKMAQGEMPSSEIVMGLMLLVAGVLLVTPGFVTDIFGLSLLVPSIRHAIATFVQKHLMWQETTQAQAFILEILMKTMSFPNHQVQKIKLYINTKVKLLRVNTPVKNKKHNQWACEY